MVPLIKPEEAFKSWRDGNIKITITTIREHDGLLSLYVLGAGSDSVIAPEKIHFLVHFVLIAKKISFHPSAKSSLAFVRGHLNLMNKIL